MIAAVRSPVAATGRGVKRPAVRATVPGGVRGFGATALGGGSSSAGADRRRHAPRPRRDPGRRGATAPAGHHGAAAAAPPRPRPAVRSPHAPVMRDGGSTAVCPAPAGQTATRAPPTPLPPPLAVFSQPGAPAAAHAAGHGGLRTLGALPRRPRRARGLSGVLPRRSGARSAAAGFPGAEGIALARPLAAPSASSEWTGFLWHPPGPGRRGSAPRPRTDPFPHRAGGRQVLPAPSEKGPAGGTLFCAPGQLPGGGRLLARVAGAAALAWAGFINPTAAEAGGVRSRRLVRSPKFG